MENISNKKNTQEQIDVLENQKLEAQFTYDGEMEGKLEQQIQTLKQQLESTREQVITTPEYQLNQITELGGTEEELQERVKEIDGEMREVVKEMDEEGVESKEEIIDIYESRDVKLTIEKELGELREQLQDIEKEIDNINKEEEELYSEYRSYNEVSRQLQEKYENFSDKINEREEKFLLEEYRAKAEQPVRSVLNKIASFEEVATFYPNEIHLKMKTNGLGSILRVPAKVEELNQFSVRDIPDTIGQVAKISNLEDLLKQFEKSINLSYYPDPKTIPNVINVIKEIYAAAKLVPKKEELIKKARERSKEDGTLYYEQEKLREQTKGAQEIAKNKFEELIQLQNIKFSEIHDLQKKLKEKKEALQNKIHVKTLERNNKELRKFFKESGSVF